MGGVASTLVGKEKLNIGAGRGVASKGEEERVTTSRASPVFVHAKRLTSVRHAKTLDIGGPANKTKQSEKGLLTSVGFEPTPLARRGPEPRALDRSATMSLMRAFSKVGFK